MKRILLALLIIGTSTAAQAQVKISTNPGTPVKSASLLELESTNRGVVFPRVTLTAINSPAPLATDLLPGTTVYNTNDELPGGQGMYIWQGAAWSPLITSQQKGGLQLQDSALNNPGTISNLSIGGSIDNVVTSGNFAYTTAGINGLRIINISNPAAPSAVGSFNLSRTTTSHVAVNGNYAYLASDTAGLKIVNISNPATPVLTGSFSTGGTANHVSLQGNYAYVACGTAGFKIINVSNPATPTLTGSISTSVAYEVVVSGIYAYLADGPGGLKIFNISNPASPFLVGRYATGFSSSNHLFHVTVSGTYAYLADGPNGLKIINIGNPAAPTLTGSLSIGDYAYHVAISSNYAYVANGRAGVKALNINNPNSPQLAEGFATSDARASAINGNYAYIADGGGGLRVASLIGAVNTFSVTEATAQIGALRFPAGKGIVVADEAGSLSKAPVAGGLLLADASSDISTTTDYVTATTAQTITGAKTFSAGVTAPSYSGNGATLSNVMNTTGTQTVGGNKTFSSPVSIDAGDAVVLQIKGSGDIRFQSDNGLASASMYIQTGGFGTDNATLTIGSNGKLFNFNGTGGSVSSDARLKQDIVPLRQSLKKIMQLNGYSYRFKTNATDPRKEFGVLAQEVKKVLPDAVFTDDRGLYSVSYDALVPVLINAVKEQQGQIDELKKTVAELKALVLRGAKR